MSCRRQAICGRAGAVAALLLLLGAAAPARAAVAAGIQQNFTASTYGRDSAAVPPDDAIAVGAGRIVQFINGRFSIFNKADGALAYTITDAAFWAQAGVSLPSTWMVSNPRLVYDPGVGRWFAVQVDFDAATNQPTAVANHFLLAVSATSDPAGSWRGVSFPADPKGVYFADFPTLGLDANGVYLAGDMFDGAGNSVGAMLVSLPKSDLVETVPIVSNMTRSGITNDRGEILQPAVCLDGSGSADVLAASSRGLDYRMHSTLIASKAPALARVNAVMPGPATVNVPAYHVPFDPVQPDGTATLADGDTRFSSMVQTVGGVIYAVHSTEMNGRAAIQWFRISAANQALIESGFLADPDLDLIYPSIAANANGTVVIACNGSGARTFVSSYAFVGQTSGGSTTFGPRVLLKAGTANYHDWVEEYLGESRWGDYSAVTVDPENPACFWTIQTYPSGPDTWSTQCTQLLTGQVQLSASPVGNYLQISWPTVAGGQLQSTSSLDSPAWTPVTQTPETNGNVVSVLVPMSAQQQFFSLRAP